jgi:hypothetical protein
MASESEHLIEQLTKGFELRPYSTKPWITVKRNGRRIGIVHDGANEVGLWLREPNDVSEALPFEITKDKFWRGGRCTVNQETVKACRQALLAAKT